MADEEKTISRRPPPWRATMARRLFVWFSVVILATVVLSSCVHYLFWHMGYGSPWRKDLDRLKVYASHRIADTWDTPQARDAMLSQAANDFENALILRGPRGESLRTFGDTSCCDKRSLEIAILPRGAAREAAPLGTLEICPKKTPGYSALVRVVVLLMVILALLYVASWLLSRALARPLTELSEVASRIGHGDLSTRAPDGAPSGIEIEELSEAINDMAARIEKQLREQRELLAAVSHELRTPIGHLRLLVGMAEEDGFTPKQIEELERELLEMEELVDQLLATSRLNFELGETHEVDVLALAIDSLERMGLDPTLLEAHGELEIGFAIDGDATLLARAITNLVRNAQTHGGGLERLHLHSDEAHIRIDVVDAGPGLPTEQLERLSQPFARGATTRSGSLGLGLFLARRISQAHNGTLRAIPREGGGVIIAIELPRTHHVD